VRGKGEEERWGGKVGTDWKETSFYNLESCSFANNS